MDHEKLYAVTHPTDGLMYGIGPTRESAWANAVTARYGALPEDLPLYKLELARLRRHGWVTKEIKITLAEPAK